MKDIKESEDHLTRGEDHQRGGRGSHWFGFLRSRTRGKRNFLEAKVVYLGRNIRLKKKRER